MSYGFAAPPEGAPRPHYHPIGITFHWAMAALVFFQLFWGWRVSQMEAGYDKLDGYAVHALVGVILLLLAFMRAGWRLIAPFVLPELEKPEDLPGWQKLAAEATHIGLYLMMFALPLSGWLMLSANAPEGGLRLPWGQHWPALPFTDALSFIDRAQLEQWADVTHFTLVWGIVALMVMHIGAALKHHFIDRDDVLARMIPWLSREESGSGGKSLEAKNASAAR